MKGERKKGIVRNQKEYTLKKERNVGSRLLILTILRRNVWYCQGKHTDWSRPPWPGTIVTICRRCFTTGGPGKEHGTNKPPRTRIQERSKGDTTCPTTSQNPPLWHPSWLNKACTTRKGSESEWLAIDNPETNPITIKPKTASHMAEQFSWLPLPYCSPPGCSFPIKSIALSAHVSPWTIHFWGLDKSPVSGPGRGPPSCNRTSSLETQQS